LPVGLQGMDSLLPSFFLNPFGDIIVFLSGSCKRK